MTIALVCGASRGLGRSIALELARAGYAVAACARTAEDVERLRFELEQNGDRVLAAACDLRDEASVRRFVERVESELGPIDVMVANAATLTVGPIASRTSRDFDEALDSTFKTALYPALAALPSMRARGQGTLVFVTSIGAKIGVPHLAPYSAAKFATLGFAEALSAEVARDGVRVLTVIPGLMRTGSQLHAWFAGDPEKEYAWFSASAILPLLSIDADRAARRIVRAIRRGDRRLVYTLPARLVARFHDLAPGLFGLALRLAGRMLPRAPAGSRIDEGQRVQDSSRSTVIELLRGPTHAIGSRHGQN